MLAVTLDYWDTLYVGAALPERVTRRKAALRRLMTSLGADLGDTSDAADAGDAAFDRLYDESGEEAERWWAQQRGYVAADRIRWMLERAGLACGADDPALADAIRAVDDALLAHPPAMVPGAADAVRALVARGVRLAIVSDTGFASGAAQTAILARDGLAECFTTLVYSCDVGHAKPHAAPFRAALEGLGSEPRHTLHIGDIERTDIRGALGAGMRALRLDAMRHSGGSAAEHVARSWADAMAYIDTMIGRSGDRV